MGKTVSALAGVEPEPEMMIPTIPNDKISSKPLSLDDQLGTVPFIYPR